MLAPCGLQAARRRPLFSDAGHRRALPRRHDGSDLCRKCFLPSPEAKGQPFQSVAPPRATPAGRDPNGSVQPSCPGLGNRPLSSLGQDIRDPSGVGASKRDSNHPAVQAHLAGQAPAPCPHPVRSRRSQSHGIRESLEPRLVPSLLRDKRDCLSDPRPTAAAPSLPFKRTEHGE